MSDQTSNSPPPIPTASSEPKSKWRGLKIAAGIVLGVVLVFKFFGSSNSSSIELELTRKYSDGTVVEIINIGGTPIKITNVTINDRPDCKVGLFDLLKDSKGVPADLKVGDKLELWSPSCRIIQVNVETDRGSRTYTFSGN